MASRKNTPGCATCCPTSGSTMFIFNVGGCPTPFAAGNYAQPGAVVVVTQGATTFTLTTDSGGHAAFSLPTGGVWTWTITPASARQVAISGSTTVTTGGTTTITRNLSPAAGYVCAFSCPTPVIAGDLGYSDSLGASGTLHWNGDLIAPKWSETGFPNIGPVSFQLADAAGGGCGIIASPGHHYGYFIEAYQVHLAADGVFTGCSVPSNSGPGTGTVFYVSTAVSQACIPFNATVSHSMGLYILTGTTTVAIHE